MKKIIKMFLMVVALCAVIAGVVKLISEYSDMIREKITEIESKISSLTKAIEDIKSLGHREEKEEPEEPVKISDITSIHNKLDSIESETKSLLYDLATKYPDLNEYKEAK